MRERKITVNRHIETSVTQEKQHHSSSEKKEKKENGESGGKRTQFYLEEGKMCQYFIDGYCKYGDRCHDIHEKGCDEKEYNAKTPAKGGNNSNRKDRGGGKDCGQKYEYKPVLCQFYLDGYCRFGSVCWNIHKKKMENEEKQNKRINPCESREKRVIENDLKKHESEKLSRKLQQNNCGREQPKRDDNSKKYSGADSYQNDGRDLQEKKKSSEDNQNKESCDVYKEMYFLEKGMKKIKRYLEANPQIQVKRN